MREAYIVKAYRTAVGKAPRGFFKFKRPDELAAETIEYLISQIPGFDKTQIDDLIVGNAMPEAEQGFNVARLISLMGLKVDDVPGSKKKTGQHASNGSLFVHAFLENTQNNRRKKRRGSQPKCVGDHLGDICWRIDPHIASDQHRNKDCQTGI